MTPRTVSVLASGVKPYQWSLWCRIEGGEPFANEIVGVRPSDCGEYLWFMLDSHNFMKVRLTDVLHLIPREKR